MRSVKKLYHLTSEDFQLPLYYRNGVVRAMPAKDTPQLTWPDGTACWLPNLYLIKGLREGKSRENGGGTLLTWAKNLSHLVRWCFEKKRDFFDLVDEDFVDFIEFLKEEKVPNRPDTDARSSRQVNTIAGTVLNFLAYVDTIMPGLGLIGLDCKIKAEQKEFEIKRGGKPFKVKAWTHECLPSAPPTRRRQPITTNAVERLHDANAASDKSPFIKRRRYILLRLMEITGGRRIEVARVTVQHLLDAQNNGELKLFSAKKGGNKHRYVPVTMADLKELLSFVKHYRQPLIRKTVGLDKDHGFIFVAEKNGLPLKEDTLGSELSSIREAAGIVDEEACLHAVRHRYITHVLRSLSRTHRCENESDLKKAMLSVVALKQKLMEWTGHSSLASLERYVHLAFEAEANFKQTLDVVQATKVVESLQSIIEDYRGRAEQSGWTPQLFREFEDVVAATQLELSQLFVSQELETVEV